MLATVLRGKLAEQQSIFIMRTLGNFIKIGQNILGITKI